MRLVKGWKIRVCASGQAWRSLRHSVQTHTEAITPYWPMNTSSWGLPTVWVFMIRGASLPCPPTLWVYATFITACHFMPCRLKSRNSRNQSPRNTAQCWVRPVQFLRTRPSCLQQTIRDERKQVMERNGTGRPGNSWSLRHLCNVIVIHVSGFVRTPHQTQLL